MSTLSRRSVQLLPATLLPAALVIAAAVAFPVTPASAAPGSYYSIELAAAPAEAKLPVKGVLVSCAGTRCVAPRASTAPATMCSTVARKLGTVASFAANGKPFDAEAIERCNGRA